jgi:hypothetical protein
MASRHSIKEEKKKKGFGRCWYPAWSQSNFLDTSIKKKKDFRGAVFGGDASGSRKVSSILVLRRRRKFR